METRVPKPINHRSKKSKKDLDTGIDAAIDAGIDVIDAGVGGGVGAGVDVGVAVDVDDGNADELEDPKLTEFTIVNLESAKIKELCGVCKKNSRGHFVGCNECKKVIHKRCGITPCERPEDPSCQEYGIYICLQCHNPGTSSESEDLEPALIVKVASKKLEELKPRSSRSLPRTDYNENKKPQKK